MSITWSDFKHNLYSNLLALVLPASLNVCCEAESSGNWNLFFAFHVLTLSRVHCDDSSPPLLSLLGTATGFPLVESDRSIRLACFFSCVVVIFAPDPLLLSPGHLIARSTASVDLTNDVATETDPNQHRHGLAEVSRRQVAHFAIDWVRFTYFYWNELKCRAILPLALVLKITFLIMKQLSNRKHK